MLKCQHTNCWRTFQATCPRPMAGFRSTREHCEPPSTAGQADRLVQPWNAAPGVRTQGWPGLERLRETPVCPNPHLQSMSIDFQPGLPIVPAWSSGCGSRPSRLAPIYHATVGLFRHRRKTYPIPTATAPPPTAEIRCNSMTLLTGGSCMSPGPISCEVTIRGIFVM